MTTYYTRNPLGSSAAKDLYDNAQNLDHRENDLSNETWPDRLGVPRLTWFGIEKQNQRAIAGYGFITMDSFQAGATLTLPNQALRDTSTGEYYRWDGALPKIVPAGSTPATAGGVASGAWVSVGDASLRANLGSSEAGMGASLIALLHGGTVQSAIIYITPFMFGAVGDGTTDDTAAIRTAISVAKSLKYSLDLRGGSWFITGTLDFTGLRMVLSDADSKILVDSTNFTSSYTAVYAITIGSPDADYSTNRASGFSLVGTLNLESQNRTSVCNGIFIKASLSHIDSLRVTGFNGEGVKLSATWDTKIGSISCELCGNVSSWQFSIVSGGDTSNCLNIGRIQSERAYQKCCSISAIRSVFGPIHAERTAIISASDGTTSITSGLTYLTFNISVGNCSFGQIIHDCITSGTAPDGTALAATIPSVVLNLDFSRISACGMSTSYISTTFGRYSEYGVCRAVNWYFGASSSVFGNVVTSAYVSGTLYPLYKTKFVGGLFANIIPLFNSDGLTFDDCDITAMTFSNNIYGNISFNKCRFPSTYTLGDTKVPTGYSGQSVVAETKSPVTFNDCEFLGSVTGAYQSRAIFRGGYIASVVAASRAAMEFYGVTIGSFNHADTNNRGYITRQVKCNNVTAWNPPNIIYYPQGTHTDRIGADSSSAGQVFWCASSSAFTWTKAY